MKGLVPTARMSLVIVAAALAISACTLASTSSASAGVTGSTRFAVTRVPTTVSSSDLSYPGSGGVNNAFSPAQSDLTSCNWLDGIPNVPVLLRTSPNYPGTKCTPLISGKDFGLLQSPLNAHFGYEVLRVAHAEPKTHAVSVGPVLLTFEDGAGARPSAASADDWIWLYVPEGNGADVLRFSSTSGVLLQKISIPSTEENPVLAANDEGLFIGWSNQGGLAGGVYFVFVGSSRAQLVQTTKLFAFMMEGGAHSMTVVEAADPSGPFVAYRFTPSQN
jgi:hypothetical protein